MLVLVLMAMCSLFVTYLFKESILPFFICTFHGKETLLKLYFHPVISFSFSDCSYLLPVHLYSLRELLNCGNKNEVNISVYLGGVLPVALKKLCCQCPQHFYSNRKILKQNTLLQFIFISTEDCSTCNHSLC